MDRISKEQRSKNMAAVKGRGNITTELALVRLFRKKGISGWRRHKKGIQGNPDFVFERQHVAVFVDGCFWHGCTKHRKLPASNTDFWRVKIDRNKARDRSVSTILKKAGWKIVRIWEHDISKRPDQITERINLTLQAK